MKKDQKYDIFISYRREGGVETAKHLRDILTEKGYRVFFDTDSLTSGDFNQALFDKIEQCKDFVIILGPGALDRCVNEGDWVRQELACALRNHKNVIPIMREGFKFPKDLPEDIASVRKQNGIKVDYQYFDAVVDTLISFLHSKPAWKRILQWLIPAAVVCCLAIAAIILQPWKSQTATPSSSPAVQATPVQAENSPLGNMQPETFSYEKNVLMPDIFPSGEWYNSPKWTVLGSKITREEIGSVTVLDTLNGAPEDAWDVSQYGDSSVKAWAVKNGDLYDLFIAGKGGVSAPSDCSVLFCGYKNAKSFNFGNAFHTDNTTDMRYMFSCCGMRGLNLSSFLTDKVSDMSAMFQYCDKLQALDISSFRTDSVKNMERMFLECKGLTQLDLNSFATPAVTDMSEMFFNDSSLRELDLNGFTLTEVTDIEGMFFGCSALENLTLSRFDTSKLQKADDLFTNCSKLKISYDGTEANWKQAGLQETLPESAEVYFAQGEAAQDQEVGSEHIWGNYIPEGTATIITKDGTHYTAVANSLIRKAKGIEPLRSWPNLYSGFDNPSEKNEYSMQNMIFFSDMLSVTKEDNLFKVTDKNGNTKDISLLTDASLLFIGSRDTGFPQEIKEKDIVSMNFDWSQTPAADIQYCTVTQTDGSFKTPAALIWFFVNQNEATGNPPSLVPTRELSQFFDREISISDLERIEITKNPTDSEFAGSAEEFQTEMRLYLKSGEQLDLTVSKFFSIYAKAGNGLVHTLQKSRLCELVFS